jgi:hypothetical protein
VDRLWDEFPQRRADFDERVRLLRERSRETCVRCGTLLDGLPADPVNPVDPVDPGEPPDSAGPVGAADPVEAGERADPEDPVGPAGPGDLTGGERPRTEDQRSRAGSAFRV